LAIKEVSDLESRGDETSADMGTFKGASRAIAVKIMEMFSGAIPFAKPEDEANYYKEILSLINIHIKNVRMLYADITPEEITSLFGGSEGDHPYSVARLVNILRYGRTLDAMAAQNTFLRYIVTYTSLTDSGAYEAAIVAKIQNTIAQLKSSKTAAGQKMVGELQTLLVQHTKKMARDGQGMEEVKDTLIGLIKDVGYDGESLKSNKPLTDVIDFILASKVRTLLTLNDLKKGLSDAQKQKTKNPKALESLKKSIANFQNQLSNGDDILLAIKKDIGKRNNIFVEKIKNALDPDITVASARKQRRALVRAVGEVDDLTQVRTRVAVGDEGRDISGVSIKDLFEDPEKVQKAQAETMERAYGQTFNIDRVATPIGGTRPESPITKCLGGMSLSSKRLKN
jgi:hypothetical protein